MIIKQRKYKRMNNKKIKLQIFQTHMYAGNFAINILVNGLHFYMLPI